jgi:hypothetical protein
MHRGKTFLYTVLTAICLSSSLLAGYPAYLIEANAAAKIPAAIPAARVAWQLVGRGLINPATGMVQVLGYFTFLEGVPGPMFLGAPSEATAFFTLRSDPFTLQTIPNGDILVGLLGPETFSFYLDTTPNQNFSDPASFSDGQSIVTLNRLPAQLILVGPVATDKFSTELISSQDFFWQEQKFNLAHLTPHGVTVTVTASTALVPSGVADFPFFLAFGATAVAIE